MFWGLSVAFPPNGLGEESPFVDNDVLYAEGDGSSGIVHEEPVTIKA
jgi:hypothetical protein